ncbi:MAG TPA: ABC transporter ATP-binding protein [Tepidisphaeraceae bacterium]|jgi:ABC-2 type transport system ATP-binding protein|nr:ABC transporter ATP-binding protein [Tepidisphaeraceae bacterium]
MVAMIDTPMEDSEATNSPAVVEVQNVSRRFGKKLALDDVSLSVPAGTVLGLVGENGAGKTTLIKHLLGLLKAQMGSVRVLGLDPVEKPVQVLSQIGYLSEEPELPGWMRVHELIRYVSAFYAGWDHAYAEQLRQEFALDPMMKVKNLSKGQRARAGLLVALAYRPSLLLLDEPSSGLDPIVRRDILGAIVRTIADEGRTVIFSSHLLTEVERVSDRVAMIRSGRILFCDSIDCVKQSHARLTLQFDESRTTAPELEGALAWEGFGREWTAVYTGRKADLIAHAKLLGGHIVDEHALSLDEIFLARTGHQQPMLQASEVNQ